jgi:NAD(P)-dependent dehydrogenase (short-subunit alcohol dehydrogenase family)
MHTLRRIADKLAESTVVLSYTSLGYTLRRPLWDDPDLQKDMTGKVVVVTGANAGLGFATVRALAQRGATVVMACRNAKKGEVARKRILEETGNPHVALEVVDVSELSSVRSFADRIIESHDRIDVLIHNAGMLAHERTTTSEGVETTFATHVLGPFVMTHLLRGSLVRGAPSRVIWITSGGMYTTRLDVDDLQFERSPFDGVKAYARCKRAQVMLVSSFADELRSEGIVVHGMHPGWADTPGVATSLPMFHRVLRPMLRNAEQGADTALWLAVSDEPMKESGKLFFDRAARREHVLPWTQGAGSDRKILWDTCRRLGGLT